jgi:hypothetical protein
MQFAPEISLSLKVLYPLDHKNPRTIRFWMSVPPEKSVRAGFNTVKRDASGCWIPGLTRTCSKAAHGKLRVERERESSRINLLSTPGDDGVGFDLHAGLAPFELGSRENNSHNPIRCPKPESSPIASLQDAELVTESEDLSMEGKAGWKAEDQGWND